jgi:hypothetical protein
MTVKPSGNPCRATWQMNPGKGIVGNENHGEASPGDECNSDSPQRLKIQWAMILDARAEALARVAPMWYELCCPEVLSAKVRGGNPLRRVGMLFRLILLTDYTHGT